MSVELDARMQRRARKTSLLIDLMSFFMECHDLKLLRLMRFMTRSQFSSLLLLSVFEEIEKP